MRYTFVFCFLCLMGCDNRDKNFFLSNAAPVSVALSKEGFVGTDGSNNANSSLGVIGSTTVVGVDTVKWSRVSVMGASKFDLNTGNSKSSFFLSLGTLPLGFRAILNDVNFSDGDLLKTGSNMLVVNPSRLGDYVLNIKVFDNFGNSNIEVIRVNVFDNYLPFPFVEVFPLAIISQREYLLDASKSFDRDFRFGGLISTYSFSVNGSVIVRSTKSSSVKYVFPSSGVFEVLVIVTDNDNVSSSYSTLITVN